MVRRYCYEIEMLEPSDVVGHTANKQIHADMESSQLSGTALTVKEVYYPLAAPAGNGMSGDQITVVEDILADCQGVVAWGGEMDPLKQSHFQIDVPPHDSRLKTLAAGINNWNDHPGKGAGAIDAFHPSCVSRSRKARNAR
ncbi:hypothetical protein [Streptomyces calidiresistens]|uniref:hypothetical protein n=1 Tax=Streptomyces calidiresistens TaxID=1485586 RepID=UPI002B216924|nr:hypothetical protein [Streptomyces calidiresistens]